MGAYFSASIAFFLVQEDLLTLSQATAQYCAAASCYKEVTFNLTINVFWSQQHIVQRKHFFVCMLVKFAGIIFTHNAETLYSSEYRNIIIIVDECTYSVYPVLAYLLPPARSQVLG